MARNDAREMFIRRDRRCGRKLANLRDFVDPQREEHRQNAGRLPKKEVNTAQPNIRRFCVDLVASVHDDESMVTVRDFLPSDALEPDDRTVEVLKVDLIAQLPWEVEETNMLSRRLVLDQDWWHLLLTFSGCIVEFLVREG